MNEKPHSERLAQNRVVALFTARIRDLKQAMMQELLIGKTRLV